jgi:hypothetical protein
MSKPAQSQAAVADARRVAIVGPVELAGSACRVLASRHLQSFTAATSDLAGELQRGAVVAVVAPHPLDGDSVERIGQLCADGARAGRPVLVLIAPEKRNAADDAYDATALAHLRAHGAALISDPDAWVEAIALVALFGVPRGSRAALIAADDTFLAALADAVAAEAELIGVRTADLHRHPDAPTDVVLHDVAITPDGVSAPLCIPVAPRSELWDGQSPALLGLRAALAACLTVGRASERITAGLGAAPREASRELEIDRERLTRQLERIGPWDAALGDHETKVLLSAYGVAITRQAVATTPSAAIRVARKAGFPVEMKAWGPDVRSELEGCPVQRGLTTSAHVRRAFAELLGTSSESAADGGGAVIVRETPPAGREVRVRIERIGQLGWSVILETGGTVVPMAGPAPLRLADARLLAAHLPSSRSGDPDPDRVALANLLRRASHLVVDHEDRIERLLMDRILVGGPRTMVVDARLVLRPR